MNASGAIVAVVAMDSTVPVSVGSVVMGKAYGSGAGAGVWGIGVGL